jgi:hypothetical protein
MVLPKRTVAAQRTPPANGIARHARHLLHGSRGRRVPAVRSLDVSGEEHQRSRCHPRRPRPQPRVRRSRSVRERDPGRGTPAHQASGDVEPGSVEVRFAGRKSVVLMHDAEGSPPIPSQPARKRIRRPRLGRAPWRRSGGGAAAAVTSVIGFAPRPPARHAECQDQVRELQSRRERIPCRFESATRWSTTAHNRHRWSSR